MANYDLDFICERADQLKRLVEADKRNARMDRYERTYHMDVWPDAPRPNEWRVTIPIGFNVVESMRALLITRRPQLSVPYPSSDTEAQERAQKQERYLYGVVAQTNFQHTLAHAQWNAVCLGEGVLKCCWMPNAAWDELPIAITAPDPRTICGIRSVQDDRFTELIHSWPRSRREIQNEWGDKFTLRPDPAFDLEQQAVWWDEEVEYIEWYQETMGREPVPEPEPEMKLLADLVGESFLQSVEGAAGLPELYEMGNGERDVGTETDTTTQRKKKTRPVRRVTHGVIVEDADAPDGKGLMLKKPQVMPGYKRIPYVRWAGVSTPGGPLSVLYPLTGGAEHRKALGIIAALSVLASIDLTAAIISPNSPYFVDTQESVEIDTDPNAINFVPPGTKVWRVAPDSTNPAVVRMYEQFKGVLSETVLPEVLSGQVYQLSGQAISGLTNAFTRRLAFMQQDLETALEQVFGIVLCLTKKYADPDNGWTAWGRNHNNRYVEQVMKPEDVDEAARVVAKLDASLPKDEMQMIGLLVQLIGAEIISTETAQDMIQKMIGLAADTPMDETKRILRDKILKEGSVAKLLATALGREALTDLQTMGVLAPEVVQEAQALLFHDEQGPPQPPQGQMGPTPNGLQAGMSGAPGEMPPMGGGPPDQMPPGAMPPQMPQGAY